MTQAPSLFGVILAGGSGTRFWPLSRSQFPKQVLRLLGSESMLAATIQRLLPRIPIARLAVVTSASQEYVIRLELHRGGYQDVPLWLEPMARNTAAAVGLAAVHLQDAGPETIMAVFPADHFIQDQERFLEALDEGARLAGEGHLVTFGVTPTRPETGYGYIIAQLAMDGVGRALRVSRFVEKPGPEAARALLQAGGCYWNSGIFLFRRDVLWEALRRHLPDLHRGLARLADEKPPPSLAAIYEDLPAISLDHGVLEWADNLVVVPVDMGWSDVGAWSALFELLPSDARGNIVVGRALERDSTNSLIYAQDRLVAAIGLKDVIVVDTPDATLVCHRERVQEVRDLVAELTRRRMVESVHHPRVERPWGSYTVMDSGPGYKVKQVVVAPGQRLSLQLHHLRAEHWVVVQGTARVTIGPETRLVPANESVFVPLKTPHRLENPGDDPLCLIEVQTGVCLEEDDVVRLDDDFWRLPVAARDKSI